MKIKFEKKPFGSQPDKVVISFRDPILDQPHQLLLPADLTDEQIEEEIHKYLYGYEDGGVHFPGYYDLYNVKHDGG